MSGAPPTTAAMTADGRRRRRCCENSGEGARGAARRGDEPVRPPRHDEWASPDTTWEKRRSGLFAVGEPTQGAALREMRSLPTLRNDAPSALRAVDRFGDATRIGPQRCATCPHVHQPHSGLPIDETRYLTNQVTLLFRPSVIGRRCRAYCLFVHILNTLPTNHLGIPGGRFFHNTCGRMGISPLQRVKMTDFEVQFEIFRGGVSMDSE